MNFPLNNQQGLTRREKIEITRYPSRSAVRSGPLSLASLPAEIVIQEEKESYKHIRFDASKTSEHVWLTEQYSHKLDQIT